MISLLTIDLKEAKIIAEKIIAVAEERKGKIAVTIIDATGKRLVSLTMDGAIPITPELSEKKARLALKMHLATIRLQEQDVNVMDFGDGYSSFGGGIPIKGFFPEETFILGAIGVSGLDKGAKDHDVAVKGLGKYFSNV